MKRDKPMCNLSYTRPTRFCGLKIAPFYAILLSSMLCQQCHKNPATQVIGVIRDGKAVELTVCNECAKILNPLAEGLGSLMDVLFSIAKGTPPPPMALKKIFDDVASKASADASSASNVCRVCGMTRATLTEQRRFGCPACYAAFPEDVATFLQELQYGEKHVGRVPQVARRRHRIAALRQELASAVKANDFERAIQLRDRIRGMGV